MSFEERVEVHIDGVVCPLAECDLVLTSHEPTGPLQFSVESTNRRALFEVRFKGNEALYPQVGGPACLIKTHRGVMPLADYFGDDARLRLTSATDHF
jgi:hypothetical protein